MPSRIVLFGQGGHAKVVADALLACDHRITSVYDDNPKADNIAVFGGVSVEPAPIIIEAGEIWHVAIGSNIARLSVIKRYQNPNISLITIVHPSASVSTFSNVGQGTFVAALATIGVDSVIGQGCIVNHGAVVDHDCSLADGVHVAPNATLAGGVQVGKATLVGAGAVVLPNIKVGDNVIIGAGAVVTTDIPDGQKVMGVPGRNSVC